MSRTESYYRGTLSSEYSARRQRNPGYSLRAYARDLGMVYSRLHEAMNGKRGISSSAAVKVAAKLGLSVRERDLFVADVEALHGRSVRTRSEALAKIKKLTVESAQRTIQLDAFEIIAHWHHYAILELTRTQGFVSSVPWIQERLGLRAPEVRGAIDRLLRLGMLTEQDGKWKAADDFIFPPSDVPSNALKLHQEQLLNRAKTALVYQAVDQRDLTSMTMAINSAELPRAKELLKKFRREFSRDLEATPGKDSVYCLALQFFRLDQPPKETS